MKQPAIRALQAKDLICGMSVDIQKARFKVRYLAKTYYFCSRECLELFNWGAKLYSTDLLEALPPTRLVEEITNFSNP